MASKNLLSMYVVLLSMYVVHYVKFFTIHFFLNTVAYVITQHEPIVEPIVEPTSNPGSFRSMVRTLRTTWFSLVEIAAWVQWSYPLLSRAVGQRALVLVEITARPSGDRRFRKDKLLRVCRPVGGFRSLSANQFFLSRRHFRPIFI